MGTPRNGRGLVFGSVGDVGMFSEGAAKYLASSLGVGGLDVALFALQ